MPRSYTIDARRNILGRKVRFASTGEPIYAAMITGKDRSRANFARMAICNFLVQTHPNRYLIIVNDGDFSFRLPGVPPDRVVQVQLRKRHRLGTLRNKAFDYIPPDALYMQWDDDDWRAPELMAAQLRSLQRSRVEGCALGRQVKYVMGMNTAWEHVLPPEFNGFSGTILVRMKPEIRYPVWRRHEDSSYWTQFRQRYSFRRWENPASYYLRLIHASSTSTHFRLFEKNNDEWTVSPESDRFLRRLLPRYGVSPARLRRRRLSRQQKVISP